MALQHTHLLLLEQDCWLSPIELCESSNNNHSFNVSYVYYHQYIKSYSISQTSIPYCYQSSSTPQAPSVTHQLTAVHLKLFIKQVFTDKDTLYVTHTSCPGPLGRSRIVRSFIFCFVKEWQIGMEILKLWKKRCMHVLNNMHQLTFTRAVLGRECFTITACRNIWQSKL